MLDEQKGEMKKKVRFKEPTLPHKNEEKSESLGSSRILIGYTNVPW